MREAFIPRIQNHTPIYAPELINYFSSNYLNAHETVFYEVPMLYVKRNSIWIWLEARSCLCGHNIHIPIISHIFTDVHNIHKEVAKYNIMTESPVIVNCAIRVCRPVMSVSHSISSPTTTTQTIRHYAIRYSVSLLV